MNQTTPRLFYEFFVLPNYEDFSRKPQDVRLGFNACLSAFQQADVFYNYCTRRDPERISAWPKPKNLLISLCKREPQFATVQSVATAYKHLYPEGTHYIIGSPMACWGIVTKEAEIVRQWGEGPEDGMVIVRCLDGSKVVLREALEAVVHRLWPTLLPEGWY